MIERTRYFDEFLFYFDKAKRQQELCNLGTVPHLGCGIEDDLMENVQLYDVVERKYAGFGQILQDVFHGWTPSHPYWEKMKAGLATQQRQFVANLWTGTKYGLEEWAFIFLVHRITGSAIDYSKNPSGYHNTVLPYLMHGETIEEMVDVFMTAEQELKIKRFTSVGYQFPQFPKPPEGYKLGGEYYMDEFAPKLVREFVAWLVKGPKKTFREMGQFALDWNVAHGLKRYHFQYAAWVADFADFFPEYVEVESPFYYGTNAVECLSYLAKPVGRMKKQDFLDEVMEEIYAETGSLPYNAEDVACDFIRWMENYVRPGEAYSHVDRDACFSSSRILDHPRGRQRAMLTLGMVDSFNTETHHPADFAIINREGIGPLEYQRLCRTIITSSTASTPISSAKV